MSLLGKLRHLGLTAKLTVPFVIILVGALSSVGAVAIRTSQTAMVQSLEKRAEVLVKNLSLALADPFMTYAFEILQQLLDEAKKADTDVVYAILLNLEGKAVATTDSTLKNQTLLRNELEKSMAQVTTLARKEVPGKEDLFEMAMPVMFQSKPQGVLRVGFSVREAKSIGRRAGWMIAGVGLFALLIGIVVYPYVAQRIVRPIRAMAATLTELASGDADLTQRLEIRSRDEVGHLAQAMNAYLDNLRELIREIKQTSVDVASASQQLSGASSHLSSGSQEQASSLEETAASLEEITGTVKQNADNARQANQLAMRSRDVAELGGQVVETAVTAMDEINKSSKKIADIITTIDEIAFQTNLLALNAAVEAARAGEQGRGFAVVAAEVRNLAQRSATAAKEIKGLIQDSVAKVESGSALVTKSGQTLGEIVSSVKRVTDIIGEIAGASQEQSTGIDQVNRAVSQMDRVVQSSAAETEELLSTAQSLTTQARQLQALVARFKLRDEEKARAILPVHASPDKVHHHKGEKKLPAKAALKDTAPGSAHHHGSVTQPERAFEDHDQSFVP
jgi:methyl-accepting chemotaxis protein